MPQHRIATLFAILMITPMIVGCAALASPDAPGCKGSRRPANLHGSVLSPDAATAPTAGAQAGQCATWRP
jgi:hypothetical protein